MVMVRIPCFLRSKWGFRVGAAGARRRDAATEGKARLFSHIHSALLSLQAYFPDAWAAGQGRWISREAFAGTSSFSTDRLDADILPNSLPKLTPANLELGEGVLEGRLDALSRAITLCESSRPDHRGQAAALFQFLVSKRWNRSNPFAFRIGVTGPPGAGKSSLIERLGTQIVAEGKKLAVLPIDPSSRETGGSILGDKTRMQILSSYPDVFVRPSPSRGQVGGLARSTSDSSLLCEIAGFDCVIIETVGSGQADTEISDSVDFVVLVLPPSGGDELQGMKKGIMEVCDMIIINKCDGEMKKTALLSVSQYKNAMQYNRLWRSKAWTIPVIPCSSHTGEGFDQVRASLNKFLKQMSENGEIAKKRKAQIKQNLLNDIKIEVMESLNNDERVKNIINEMEINVAKGLVSPRAAAYMVFKNLI